MVILEFGGCECLSQEDQEVKVIPELHSRVGGSAWNTVMVCMFAQGVALLGGLALLK